MITDHPIAVLDFETTGFPPGARAVEVAVVHLDRGKVVDSWSTLINPGEPIPPRVSEIHGIRDEDVRESPRFADALDELAEALAGRLIAAYNAPFDQAIMRGELDRIALAAGRRSPHDRLVSTPWIDPLVWARKLEPVGPRSLAAVAGRMGIRLDGAHRALADATAAAEVLARMAPKLPPTMRELALEQRKLDGGRQRRDFEAWAASRPHESPPVAASVTLEEPIRMISLGATLRVDD